VFPGNLTLGMSGRGTAGWPIFAGFRGAFLTPEYGMRLAWE